MSSTRLEDNGYSDMAVDGDLTTSSHTVIYYRPSQRDCLENVLVTVDGLPCSSKLENAAFNVVGISCPLRPRGRYLKIQLLDALDNGIITLNNVRAFGHT
eukprot:Ihof_evm3s711 gene=Ihof_evmTU3s711